MSLEVGKCYVYNGTSNGGFVYLVVREQSYTGFRGEVKDGVEALCLTDWAHTSYKAGCLLTIGLNSVVANHAEELA